MVVSASPQLNLSQNLGGGKCGENHSKASPLRFFKTSKLHMHTSTWRLERCCSTENWNNPSQRFLFPSPATKMHLDGSESWAEKLPKTDGRGQLPVWASANSRLSEEKEQKHSPSELSCISVFFSEAPSSPTTVSRVLKPGTDCWPLPGHLVDTQLVLL